MFGILYCNIQEKNFEIGP